MKKTFRTAVITSSKLTGLQTLLMRHESYEAASTGGESVSVPDYGGICYSIMKNNIAYARWLKVT